MAVNRDYKDLFRIFCTEKVEYLVVGAHAVVYYTEPRYTKDLDVWVSPSRENAERVWRALAEFGAPLMGVTLDDFGNQETIYQLGIEPNRIDILMGIGGVEFEDAWQDKEDSTYDGIPIFIIGKASLIAAKKAAGRPQDLIDIEWLET